MLGSILQPILPVLERLTQNGYEAYAVGGCVRDALLHKTPNDFDVTTNALPDQILACFGDCTVIPTGIEHGTVTVLWQGAPIEITTYRTDGVYTDARHPDSVSFTASLYEDLARRDFTVNALAADAKGGLADYFEGTADLQTRCLRAVGEPHLRFSEDALRILRLWRFAATLGFAMEEQTAQAAVALAPSLGKIARERIFSELRRGLCGTHLAPLLCHPLTAAVFAEVLPPLCPALALTRTQAALNALDDSFPLRFAALCACADVTADRADALLDALRCDRATRQKVALLLGACGEPLPDTRIACKWALSRYGEDFFAILTLHAALYEKDVTSVRDLARDLLQSGACLSLDRLAISGHDLLAVGVPAGKAIGTTLQALLCAVIEERVENEKEALLLSLSKL